MGFPHDSGTSTTRFGLDVFVNLIIFRGLATAITVLIDMMVNIMTNTSLLFITLTSNTVGQSFFSDAQAKNQKAWQSVQSPTSPQPHSRLKSNELFFLLRPSSFGLFNFLRRLHYHFHCNFPIYKCPSLYSLYIQRLGWLLSISVCYSLKVVTPLTLRDENSIPGELQLRAEGSPQLGIIKWPPGNSPSVGL